MASTTTSISAPDAVPADPSKRVNYTFGMVLGVDDFVQMDAYREGRDRLIARELIGYGTVWGLAVAAAPDPVDPEARERVTVTRGLAIVPSGQPVCVPVDQCAYIAPWLRTHAATGPEQSHHLFVYTAVPRSESYEKLQLLSVIGAQTLDSAPEDQAIPRRA